MDAILISANPSMVDVDDARKHLEGHAASEARPGDLRAKRMIDGQLNLDDVLGGKDRRFRIEGHSLGIGEPPPAERFAALRGGR